MNTLDDAASVLLLTPPLSDDEDERCADLLQPAGATAENMLWVSYTKSPDTQLRRWRAHGHGQPKNLRIVSVGDSTRSAAAASGGGSSTPLTPGTSSGPIETVANPNDLTGLGIRINESLRLADEQGYRTRICFDSLTAMLQYVDLETTYEFLHILIGRIYTANATAHFHMDPGAHDDQTVEALASLCDAVVDITGDELAIRSR